MQNISWFSVFSAKKVQEKQLLISGSWGFWKRSKLIYENKMKIDQSTTNGCLQHWSAAENRSGFLAKNQLHLWFITQFSTLLTWFRIRISFETVSHKVRICWIVNLRLVAGVVDRTLPERTFGRLDRPLLLATLQTQSCTGTSAVLSKPCCFSLSEYDSSGRTGRKEELPCCTNWSRNYVIIAYDI